MTSKLSVLAKSEGDISLPFPDCMYSNAPFESDYKIHKMKPYVTHKRHAVFDVPQPTAQTSPRLSPERWNECRNAVRALRSIADQHNWDGEGGSALAASTVDRAVSFLRACPAEAYLGKIDFAADATGDGDIMLTWAVGYERLLTVLITGDRKILHSGVFPSPERERTGVSDWTDSGRLPEGIAPCFDRLAAAIS